MAQFQPGHPGGPGRPKKTVEDAYLNAIKEKFTPEQVVDVLTSLLSDAKSWRAKYAAAELILHYSLGKPTQRVLTGSMDVGELIAKLKDAPE